MHIICLTPIEEGVYNDHNADHITTPPDGWAMIPEGFPLPSTFPLLGSIEAEEIEHIMTVTAMTEGTLPNPVEPSTKEQIMALKAELSATDYKVIKCSEAQLAGEELPYDIVAIHAERQALRDKINELEKVEHTNEEVEDVTE